MPKPTWSKIKHERSVTVSFGENNDFVFRAYRKDGSDFIKVEAGENKIDIRLTNWIMAFKELYPDQITFIADDDTKDDDDAPA